ncbi:uncharacterized protein LOC105700262 [Orussus abietinus]|uniref:uncharacterized protein LOC105700262 n=1 Tax=Orussus abietinus TaxID=222816 RepID=UPI000626BD0C|nr:uncharacterized protein LOC105700262 [Orussus abietinus]
MKILAASVSILLVLAARTLGYPQQERLMPDGAPVPEDVAVYGDSVAAASEVGGDQYEDEGDDSDMFMEPDGSETAMESHQAEAPSTQPPRVEESVTKEERQESVTSSQRKVSEGDPGNERSLQTDSQNFFPSFAELFSDHRLSYDEQQQQQRYRPNRFLGFFQRDRGGYQAAASTTTTGTTHPLLGSGNFGVIRGGTYYPEDKETDEYSVDETLYNPYYHGGGRTRPQPYVRNPKPQPVRGGDFFANFRDFADITAPPKSSFSHLSVVYANKNGTAGRIGEPRNIIETLRMLEEEEAETTEVEAPRKKLSNGKRKLMKIKKYQEDKARKARVTVEPLLALS